MPAILLTGLPSSGKTTVGRALVDRLARDDRPAELLDGDELRRHLPPALGFSREDRLAQAERATWIGELLVRHGIVPVLALILPFAASRADARRRLGPGCLEVHLSPPLDVCLSRDSRGAYRAATERGDAGLRSIVAPYEPPAEPDLRLDTSALTVDACADAVLEALAAVPRVGG